MISISEQEERDENWANVITAARLLDAKIQSLKAPPRTTLWEKFVQRNTPHHYNEEPFYSVPQVEDLLNLILQELSK